MDQLDPVNTVSMAANNHMFALLHRWQTRPYQLSLASSKHALCTGEYSKVLQNSLSRILKGTLATNSIDVFPCYRSCSNKFNLSVPSDLLHHSVVTIGFESSDAAINTSL